MSEQSHCRECLTQLKDPRGNVLSRTCPGCPDCAKKDARIAALEEDLDCERMRLAACGTAALGYYKRGESIAQEYTSASLEDVMTLYEKVAALEADLKTVVEALRPALKRHPEQCDCISCQALARPGVVAVMGEK